MSNQRRRAEERKLLKAARLVAEPTEPKPNLNSQQKRTKNNSVLLIKALELRQRHKERRVIRNSQLQALKQIKQAEESGYLGVEATEEALKELGSSFTEADFE